MNFYAITSANTVVTLTETIRHKAEKEAKAVCREMGVQLGAFHLSPNSNQATGTMSKKFSSGVSTRKVKK